MSSAMIATTTSSSINVNAFVRNLAISFSFEDKELRTVRSGAARPRNLPHRTARRVRTAGGRRLVTLPSSIRSVKRAL
jgi:hypothetical protein